MIVWFCGMGFIVQVGDGWRIFDDVLIEIYVGEVYVFVGLNGVGKLILFGVFVGDVMVQVGIVEFDGWLIDWIRLCMFVQQCVVFLQENIVMFLFSVEQVVCMGWMFWVCIFEVEEDDGVVVVVMVEIEVMVFWI